MYTLKADLKCCFKNCNEIRIMVRVPHNYNGQMKMQINLCILIYRKHTENIKEKKLKYKMV